MLPTAPPFDDDDPVTQEHRLIRRLCHPDIPAPADQRAAIRNQTRLADGLATRILAAVPGVTLFRPPRFTIIPNGAWQHARVVGQCFPSLHVLLPAAGCNGVELEHAGKHARAVWPPPPDPLDFRNVGLTAAAWLRLLVHELVHVVEYSRGAVDGDIVEHHRPSFAAAVARMRAGIAGKVKPPPLVDLAAWPLQDPLVDALVEIASPAVALHLAPRAQWKIDPDTGMAKLLMARINLAPPAITVTKTTTRRAS